MKKKIISMLVLGSTFFIAKETLGQVTFNHAVGGGIYYSNSNDGNANAWGINYSPRVNIMDFSDEASLSLGSNIGIGVAGMFSKSGSGKDNYTLLLDVPALLELNLGSGSGENAEADFGGFVGVGYGFNRMNYSNLLSTSVNSNGPLFTAGFRTELGGQLVGARANYMLNDGEAGNIFSLGIFYTL